MRFQKYISSRSLALGSTFLLSLACASPALAMPGKVLSPVAQWSFSQSDGDTQGLHSCTLSNSYEGGVRLSFASEAGHVHAMRFDFQEEGLRAVSTLPSVTLSFLDGKSYALDAIQTDDDALTVSLKDKPEVVAALRGAPLFTLKLGDADHRFSLTGITKSWQRLSVCRDIDTQALHFDAVQDTLNKDYNLVRTVSGAKPALTINAFPLSVEKKSELLSKDKSLHMEVAEPEVIAVTPSVVEGDNAQPPQEEIVEIARITEVIVSQPEETVIDLTQDMEVPVAAPVKTVTRIHTPKLKVVTDSVDTPAVSAEVLQKADVLDEVSVLEDDLQVQSVESVEALRPDVQALEEVSVVIAPPESETIAWRAGRSKVSVVRPVIETPDTPEIDLDNVQKDSEKVLSSLSSELPEFNAIAEQQVQEIADVSGEVKAADVAPIASLESVNLEQWSVEKGQDLREIVIQWSLEHDVELIWDVKTDFKALSSFSSGEGYERALARLLNQHSKYTPRPVGELYVDPDTQQKLLVVQEDASVAQW